MAKVTKHRAAFLDAARKLYGDSVSQMDRDMIQAASDSAGLPWPQWLTSKTENRIGRGLYTLQNVTGGASAVPAINTGVTIVSKKRSVKAAPAFRPSIPVAAAPAPSVPVLGNPLQDSTSLSTAAEVFEHESLVPLKMRGYVPFGQYSVLESIIRSGIFYPVFVTGLSGNGKTLMMEQLCANLGREFVRVNFTMETDEDDLIGGFRLADGKTVWQDGPVVIAMKRGAVLLLDEVDLGSNKIMCLQGVMEGKPIYLKKINTVVKPLKGFNVFATANTKGQGSMDGKFVGTNVLNEAFLERFAGTIEQEYPSIKTEEKILLSTLAIAFEERAIVLSDYLDTKAAEFVSRLVKWADGIRKTYAEGGCSEIISTRRLVHIVNAFVIFDQNRRQAIEFCLARFDRETKEQFMDLYTKIDIEVDKLLPPPPTPEELAAKAAAEAAEVERQRIADGWTVSGPTPTATQATGTATSVDDITAEIENLLKAKGL